MLLQNQAVGRSRWALWNHYLFSGQFEPRPVDKFMCDVDWVVILRVLKRITSVEQLLYAEVLDGLQWAIVKQPPLNNSAPAYLPALTADELD
jgi:hypothetical protein